MKPDREPGEAARRFDSVRGRRRSDHKARSGEDAVAMGDLDCPVHLVGKTEVVGRDDQIFQCAIS
jgi:hypothetical protein